MSCPNKPIAIIGFSCRLPGHDHNIQNEHDLWFMLSAGKHGIKQIPANRWPVDELQHPDRSEPGRCVTFRAGTLDDIDQFDAGFFGISPREAAWLDPQQRLLLMTAYEAIENSGIKPSSIAGSNCGVYVGISSLDYGQHALEDLASMNAYAMTGNTLSLGSNRISYCLDLHGPSLSIDTACSASLVAIHNACEAIRSGTIPFAIAGGVGLLLHPYSFIGFSKASMLSANGRCRPFDAAADGYVRGEGVGMFLLKPLDAALKDGNPIQAVILASGVNTDGLRKTGLTIPSAVAQTELMQEVLAKSGLTANDIDFIEAHGTGTPVGDPIEAKSIAAVYASNRNQVLPISSVKANVGHLEPASGVAGLVKAIACLKHGALPPVPFEFTPNTAVDFDALNIACTPKGQRLPDKENLVCGVNSFGFGGVNAHLLLQRAPEQPSKAHSVPAMPPLYITARTENSLRKLAGKYAETLATADTDTCYDIAWNTALCRDWHEKRLALANSDKADTIATLTGFAQGENPTNVMQESGMARDTEIAFVYSGNGSQWHGMGRKLLVESKVFAECLISLDNQFRQHGGYSILDALQDDDATKLQDTTIAQPLLFAIQVGVTQTLRSLGIRPQAVTGHSVGEIAAAWASGALTLPQAVQVIHARSFAQGQTRGCGRMAVLGLSEKETCECLASLQLSGIEIAGINSPSNVTLTGDADALQKMAEYARANKIYYTRLDIDYSFHSRHMENIREQLAQKLDGLKPVETKDAIFVSTVTGHALEGTALGSDYWWNNVRQPVQFASAIQELASFGYRIFVEIGPNAILLRYIRENMAAAGSKGRILPTLSRTEDGDGYAKLANLATRLHLLAGKTDIHALFPEQGNTVKLPNYQWDCQSYTYPRTSECWPETRRKSTLAGWQQGNASNWENIFDPVKDTWLADHKVGDAVVFPGAAYIATALEATTHWLGTDTVALESLDITVPMVFEQGQAQTVQTKINVTDGRFVITSRPRLATGEWTQHATGRAVTAHSKPRIARIEPVMATGQTMQAEDLYRLTKKLGLDYGPTFRRIVAVRTQENRLEAKLLDSQDTFALHPAVLDACFHSIVAMYGNDDTLQAYLPVKTGRVELFGAGRAVTHIRAEVTRKAKRTLAANFELLDANGDLVATACNCRFRALPVAKAADDNVDTWQIVPWLCPHSHDALSAPIANIEDLHKALQKDTQPRPEREIWYKQVLPLVEAFMLSSVFEAFHDIADIEPDWQAQEPFANWLTKLLQQQELLSADMQLANQSALPSAAQLWRDALRLAPECLPYLLTAGRAAMQIKDVLLGKKDGKAVLDEISNAGIVRNSQNPLWQGTDTAIKELLAQIAKDLPADRRLNVLEISKTGTGMAETLQSSLPEDRFAYVLALADQDEVGKSKSHFASLPNMAVCAFDPAHWQFEGNGPEHKFDLVIVRDCLHQAINLSACLATTAEWLAKDGVLIAAERHPDWSADIVQGLNPAWWRTNVGNTSVSTLLPPDIWEQLFADFGWQAKTWAETEAEGLNEGAYLLLASTEKTSAPAKTSLEPANWTVCADSAATELQNALTEKLIANKQTISPDLTIAENIVFAVGTNDDTGPTTISATLDKLVQVANKATADGKKHKLWVITSGGALASKLPQNYQSDPTQSAIWGLGRVIRNEYPDLDCTLIDVPAFAAIQADRLARELLYPDGRDEILLTANARYGLMLEELPPAKEPAAKAKRQYLDFSNPGRLGNLVWLPDTEKPLAADHVEAEVMATGLNFRDIMLTMGLVPDDAVENGFAGPTLGLEFAGIVSRTGQEVTNFVKGDKVVGFAPRCFASHVTAPAHALAKLPDDWSFEAAATAPTVFFTAWYALKHLASLQAGETVLIHGAAGGVGIAAIQIAKHLRARVIATAGSDEKRDFLRLLGVQTVFDSRSLDFEQEVLEATDGAGVDVVLNSLAGEAMRRSINILKPFGRFCELGKRDFVENTGLGLRPLKENISYFAIDVDQLLTAKPKLAARLFNEMMQLFHNGTFTPLPHRAYQAKDVQAAFRAMQQAQHIGKIVVTPSAITLPQTANTAPDFDPRGTWLVTGGLSGFGLATARHLADRGVKSLALVGRRGANTPDAQQILQEFAGRGVSAFAFACDIADKAAVGGLIAEISKEMPPITGIVHAAAVFADCFLPQLDRNNLKAVLAPKLAGAWHLHLATRQLPIKYFVLYSSISTVIGNPGQGNYVAANGGLEGLAHLRHSLGLPATCINWGPVGDVGYLTRNEAVKKNLAQRLGKAPLTASQAMQALDKALAKQDLQVCANLDWAGMASFMPSTARFAKVAFEGKAIIANNTTQDIRELLADKSPAEGRNIVIDLIAEELATVLGLAREQIAIDRSVQSMGLDSLMAMELVVGLEQRFGIRLPVMLLQDSPSVEKIAARIVARLTSGTDIEGSETTQLEALAKVHAVTLTATEINNIATGSQE